MNEQRYLMKLLNSRGRVHNTMDGEPFVDVKYVECWAGPLLSEKMKCFYSTILSGKRNYVRVFFTKFIFVVFPASIHQSY